ncbi:hypothetical protein JFK97_06060 [Chromobacterium phragmitis]|uniref:hypothetical protein n=1 Tax=Chromobacterium amazonense TaxID=1382803 RepID=UPI0021B80E44|nr:hypothetical protein [Chromobacterium amazonense]MBM2883950.1 hypothetical protein [Chromobacterium amazonense]MDE1711868.1 hypothetical protein [Chromobacterium amazonense]
MIRTISADKRHTSLRRRQIEQGGPLIDTPPHMKRAAGKRRERHAIEDIIFQINKPA